MTKLEARYIGIVTSRDGEYNRISSVEVVRQITEMPKEIQDEFVEGYYRQEVEKSKASRLSRQTTHDLDI